MFFSLEIKFPWLTELPSFQSGVLNKGDQKVTQANGAKSKAQQQKVAAAATAAAHSAEHPTSSATHSQTNSGSTSSTAASAAGAASNSSGGTNSSSASALDPYKLIPIQITLPPQGDSEARVLTIQLPGSVIQNNQLGQMLTAPVIQSIMSLPPALASSVLQQHVNTTLQNNSLQSEWPVVNLFVECAMK